MNLKRIIKPIVHTTRLRSVLLRFASPEVRRNRRLTKALIRELTEAGFEKILRRRDGYHGDSRKYLDLATYLEETIREARALDLLDSSGLRLLDIGCGAGYFLYILRRCGHQVLGIDIDNDPMYNELVALLDIPRIVHRVEKFKPLPDLGEPFDLVTAFSICFDCHATTEVWGTSEWKYFIEDCLRHLRPGGRIFLRFNPATRQSFDFIPDEVGKMLRRIPGACLSSNKEEFQLNYTKPITI